MIELHEMLRAVVRVTVMYYDINPYMYHRYERVEVPLMAIKVPLNLQQGVMLYPTFPLGKVGG